MITQYRNNQLLGSPMIPVDIVLTPEWWYKHEGITFDKDFFYSPARRVADERRMERALYERWGKFGLGADHDKDLPNVGPVHLGGGDLVSEMLGCSVEFKPDGPPQIIPLELSDLRLDVEAPFSSEPFRRFQKLVEQLKGKYGYLVGDVNWSGVLSIAMDLCGETMLINMIDRPEESKEFMTKIAYVLERFVTYIQSLTGTTSISVNRLVRHFQGAVYLHSECPHVMISKEHYQKFLMNIDADWSQRHRPFGIHYCGPDPHRYAELFAELPHLDFLDVGHGGNVKMLRKHLPETFLNIRLSPVEIGNQSKSEIQSDITRLVKSSGHPYLTGVCCVNMDANVPAENITTIFETVEQLRKEYKAREV